MLADLKSEGFSRCSVPGTARALELVSLTPCWGGGPLGLGVSVKGPGRRGGCRPLSESEGQGRIGMPSSVLKHTDTRVCVSDSTSEAGEL